MTVSRFLTVILCLALVSCATTGASDKKQSDAHFKLGVSHLNESSIQPAFVEFQKALQFDKNNKDAHNALGTVYLQLEDLPMAEKEFDAAGRIDSTFSDAFNNLCYVQYRLKKWDAAISNCKKALSNPIYLTPEKSFYSLGRVYYRMGNYDEAIDAYGDAIKRLPGLYLAYYGMALSYNAKGEYGKASESMTRGLVLDPRFTGDRDRAEQAFSVRTGDADEDKDYRDFLEILKY